MQIIVSGKGVDLTNAVETYVNKKLEGLDKFFAGIIRADVVLGKTTNHHQKGDIFFAECKLGVPGAELFAKKEAAAVYEAVDFLRDYLEVELKKHKVKLQGNVKKEKTTARLNKEYNEKNNEEV